MGICKFIAFAVWIAELGSAIVFRNGIRDAPHIECRQHSVELNFETLEPFEGRVFIRGHFDDPDCKRDFSGGQAITKGLFEMQFDKCGMQRQRSANPRGMMMGTVVMVSFHRHFITHLDKAYNIQCFYLEEDRTLTNSIQVSSLPMNDIDQSPPMPVCKYNVLQNDRFGDQVNFAQVGQIVYHQWSCTYPMPDMYCMLIHSCAVQDDGDDFYSLIDEDGCTKDRFLLSDLDYIDDLNAGTSTTVFKFADRPSLYFKCQVRLSLKHEQPNHICPRPQCSSLVNRSKRQITNAESLGEDFDLITNNLVVLDMEDITPKDIESNVPLLWTDGRTAGTSSSSRTQVCMSPLALGSVFGACLALILASITIITIFLYRINQPKSLLFPKL